MASMCQKSEGAYATSCCLPPPCSLGIWVPQNVLLRVMLNSAQALTVGKAATYPDLAEATGRQLVQYEDLEGQQQAGVVGAAHFAWWEQELEVCLSFHHLPWLRPCSQAQERGQWAEGTGLQASLLWLSQPLLIQHMHTSIAFLHGCPEMPHTFRHTGVALNPLDSAPGSFIVILTFSLE